MSSGLKTSEPAPFEKAASSVRQPPHRANILDSVSSISNLFDRLTIGHLGFGVVAVLPDASIPFRRANFAHNPVSTIVEQDHNDVNATMTMMIRSATLTACI
jgi:hypothetical protein